MDASEGCVGLGVIAPGVSLRGSSLVHPLPLRPTSQLLTPRFRQHLWVVMDANVVGISRRMAS